MPPIVRTSQAPQRISPGSGTRHQRTTNIESDKTPNLLLRGSHSDPLGQKKLGTRVSCLETQLIQAQQELKSLKQHLSSANKKIQSKKIPVPEETSKEMYVFEVPIQDSPELNKKDTKNIEMEQLKSDLEAKGKALESLSQEKAILEKQLNVANEEISTSKSANSELNCKVELLEASKDEMELEMRKLRVQTEQWRKAADAATLVLAGGSDGESVRNNGRRGSMDKRFIGAFEMSPFGGWIGGIDGFFGSDGSEMEDGKVRSSGGMRMFGDLWRKKGLKGM